MKYISLTKGFRAMVSDEDYDHMNTYKWCATITSGSARAVRATSAKQTIAMSHEVLRLVPWPYGHKMVVDHIDRNPLNNQRENLRIVSKAENALNSTRSDNYKGVCYHKQSGKWVAYRQGKYLGIRKTRDEALKLSKGTAL